MCVHIHMHQTSRETAAVIISHERLQLVNGFVQPVSDRDVRDQVDMFQI